MSVVTEEFRPPALLRAFFWSLAIGLGVLEVLARRFEMNSDAIAYLDIGDAFFQGNLPAAINSYWSPLYSWLLGLGQWIFKPGPYWESTVGHFTNFAIYLFGFGCFEFLLREAARSQRIAQTSDSQREFTDLQGKPWTVLAYLLFLYMSQEWIRLRFLTPDLLMAAFVFASAGMTLRARRRRGWTDYALLGAVLGLGYLAKTPMFPMAFVFLAVSALPFRSARAVLGTALAFLVFAATAGPYIAAISRAKGRVTFGDSASMNFFVRVPLLDRVFKSPSPEHTQKILFESPLIHEVQTLPGVTFAPWNDPAGWQKDRFPDNFELERRPTWRGNLENYFELLVKEQSGLTVALLALLIVSGRRWNIPKDVLAEWPMLLPALAGLGMFFVAIVEERYVAGFFVLLWIGLFSAVRLPRDGWQTKAAPAILLAAALALAIPIPKTLGGSVSLMAASRGHAYWEAAEELHKAGVQQGDAVVSVGHTRRAYWARLGKFRIVAECGTAEAEVFLAASPEVTAEMSRVLTAWGAKAIVSDTKPGHHSALAWKRLGRTDFFYVLLPRL